MKKFVIVTNYDDWEGLYVDGRLVYEGHAIPHLIFERYVGAGIVVVDVGWLHDEGYFPKDLSDIPLAVVQNCDEFEAMLQESDECQ